MTHSIAALPHLEQWAVAVIIVTSCFVQGTTVSAALSIDLTAHIGRHIRITLRTSD
jgi:hypothetical protein